MRPSSLTMNASMRRLSSVALPRISNSDSKSSMESSLSHLFSDLRLRAAMAITASLAHDQRQNLLSSMGALDKKIAEQQKRTSVGEAVAQALAQEEAKRGALWQQEEAKIVKRTQQAMEDRMMSDLVAEGRKLALERWKKELRDEVEGGNEKQMEEHPTLGPVLVDLGYKRVHVISAKALSAIPIWSQQRSYRHDRAKVMAADKMKSLDLGLPGVISLHEAEDGRLSILDGQHRVGMLTILQDKAKNTINLDQILVEVFPQSKSSTPTTHAEDLFLEINKAEPVKLVDMPRVARSKDKDIIDDAAYKLHDTFPEMFKSSQRCRPPHLNVDNLRDAIFTANILKHHSITSSSALYDWIMQRNKEMELLYKSKGSRAGVSTSALDKAKEYHFYIGLDLSWLHQSDL